MDDSRSRSNYRSGSRVARRRLSFASSTSRRKSLCISFDKNDDQEEVRHSRRQSAFRSPGPKGFGRKVRRSLFRSPSVSLARRSLGRGPSRSRKRYSLASPSLPRGFQRNEPQLSPEELEERWNRVRKLLVSNKINTRNVWDPELRITSFIRGAVVMDKHMKFEKAGLMIDSASRLWSVRVDGVVKQAHGLMEQVAGGAGSSKKALESNRQKKRKRRAHQNTLSSPKALRRDPRTMNRFQNVMQAQMASKFSAGDSEGLFLSTLPVTNSGYIWNDKAPVPIFSTKAKEKKEDHRQPPKLKRIRTSKAKHIIPKVYTNLIQECIQEGVGDVLDEFPSPSVAESIQEEDTEDCNIFEPEVPGLENLPEVPEIPEGSIPEFLAFPELDGPEFEAADKDPLGFEHGIEEFTRFYDADELKKLTWQNNWRTRKFREAATQYREKMKHQPRKKRKRKYNFFNFESPLPKRFAKAFDDADKEYNKITSEELQEWRSQSRMLPKDMRFGPSLFYRYSLKPHELTRGKPPPPQPFDLNSPSPDLEPPPDIVDMPEEARTFRGFNWEPGGIPDENINFDTQPLQPLSPKEEPLAEAAKVPDHLQEMKNDAIRAALAQRRVNVKYVKKTLWKAIKSSDGISFQELLDIVAIELPQVVVDNLSLPFLYNALLHLCNEKKLELVEHGDSFTIKVV